MSKNMKSRGKPRMKRRKFVPRKTESTNFSEGDDDQRQEALDSFKNITEKTFEEEPQNNGSDDDDADNPRAHRRLLTAISQLQRTQHIEVPTRTEITDKKNEFNLVKAAAEDVQKPLEAKVTLAGLVESLKKTKRHDGIRKELTKLQKNSKKLPKPVEKPVADKIARGIAYEKARVNLDRWDPVVEKNKVEETLVFPLVNAEEVTLSENAAREPLSYRIKSDLMLELEKLDPPKEIVSLSEKDENMQRIRDELLEQRKELAKIRRKESYQIDKARRQNKIKSKKYHKVMKKEKIRKQFADFEELQKTDPEAALKQLELIEMTRIEERAHQRHRNTGTWAKNLQVRAKFDKEARQELHQQVEIGRELKRKQNEESSSESEKEEDENSGQKSADPFNPWIKNSEANGEEFSGYRKYWDARNKNDEEMKLYNKSVDNEEDLEKELSDNEPNVNSEPLQNKKSKKSKKPLPKARKLSNGFEVEDFSDNEPVSESIDDLFDKAEDNLADVVSRKLSKIKSSLKKAEKKRLKSKSKAKTRNNESLKMKSTSNRPDLDEKLSETVNGEEADREDEPKSLRKLLEKSSAVEATPKLTELTINPNKFVTIEPKLLKTALPDHLNDEDVSDNEANDDHRLTIAEAFEDDDIVMDFKEEKDSKVKKDQPEDVNLTLPGWGSWTGSGVAQKQNKRFILKFPKDMNRKDDKKERLILNETVNDKLKTHLVSDLPFPFTSVQDYESSIRAPITRTFVPETAHRVLTKPSIVTKIGTVIKPMDESVLLQTEKPRRAKTKTDHKLADMSKRSKIAV